MSGDVLPPTNRESTRLEESSLLRLLLPLLLLLLRLRGLDRAAQRASGLGLLTLEAHPSGTGCGPGGAGCVATMAGLARVGVADDLQRKE